MIYLTFLNKNKGKKGSSFFMKCVEFMLSLFIPRANPTLEDNINKVHTWYIEYDTEEKYTRREIGLDENEVVVFKAPYSDNYGFWCDVDMNLDDYYRCFEPHKIPREEFDKLWKKNIIGEKKHSKWPQRVFWIIFFFIMIRKCVFQ